MASFMRNALRTRTWACLCLLAINNLILGGESDLEIKTVLTYFGSPARPTEIIAGDLACVAIVINGLETSKEGNVRYEPQFSLLDESGKSVLSMPTKEITRDMVLGGRSVKQLVYLRVPKELNPGKYFLRSAIRDCLNSRSAKSEIEIAVEDGSTFGAINLRFTREEPTQLTGSVFTVGQNAFLRCSATGFRTREGMTDLRVSFEVMDANDSPLCKRCTFDAKREASEQVPLDLFCDVPLHREGDFTILFTIEDRIAAKTCQYKLPVVVIEPLFTATASEAVRR